MSTLRPRIGERRASARRPSHGKRITAPVSRSSLRRLGAISVSKDVTPRLSRPTSRAGIDDVVDELKALERHALGDQLRGKGLFGLEGLGPATEVAVEQRERAARPQHARDLGKRLLQVPCVAERLDRIDMVEAAVGVREGVEVALGEDDVLQAELVQAVGRGRDGSASGRCR